MPATVIVNNLTVVHRRSGGVSVATPDVCKTQTPGGPVPVPYANVARSKNTAKGSRSLKIDGSSIMLRSSQISTSTGNEPGSLGGIVSGKTRGKAYPRMYSLDVKVEGQNVFRLSDIMLQNAGSPGNGVGNLGQSNLAAAGADPDRGRLVIFDWVVTHACCGDQARFLTWGQELDGPRNTAVALSLQSNAKNVLDQLVVEVVNDRKTFPWITYRRQHRKQVNVVAAQHTLPGEQATGNTLEIRAPADAKELKKFSRDGVAYRLKTEDDGTESWVPTTTTFRWEVCYSIEIKDGILIVTRKLDYMGARAAPRAMKRWKREIEAVWDRKFRLHRSRCLRGANCDCGWTHGCCVYLMRIRAEFGPGHGQLVELLGRAPQAADEDDLWRSHTWWTKRGYGGESVRAHEFGHLIGAYDEYGTGGCNPSGKDIWNKGSVMAWGNQVGNRHVLEFAQWFGTRAGGVVGGLKLLKNQ